MRSPRVRLALPIALTLLATGCTQTVVVDPGAGSGTKAAITGPRHD